MSSSLYSSRNETLTVESMFPASMVSKICLMDRGITPASADSFLPSLLSRGPPSMVYVLPAVASIYLQWHAGLLVCMHDVSMLGSQGFPCCHCTCPRLSVGKDCAVEAVHDLADDGHNSLLEQLLLR